MTICWTATTQWHRHYAGRSGERVGWRYTPPEVTEIEHRLADLCKTLIIQAKNPNTILAKVGIDLFINWVELCCGAIWA